MHLEVIRHTGLLILIDHPPLQFLLKSDDVGVINFVDYNTFDPAVSRKRQEA